MIKVTVAGSNGRMGRRIIGLAEKDRDIEIVSKFDTGVDAKSEIAACEVLIEFTTPEATASHIAIAERLKKAVVIGTTGLSRGDKGVIEKASANIPIVFAPNMSVGVNLLFKICRDAARILPGDYTVEMTEVHHAGKKDSPSGTAKRLAELIAGERNISAADIPVKSIREGEIVGDHKVVFASGAERIELSHSANTRDTFALGAIAAAKFLKGKKNGLYTMRDVLGI